MTKNLSLVATRGGYVPTRIYPTKENIHNWGPLFPCCWERLPNQTTRLRRKRKFIAQEHLFSWKRKLN